VEKVAADVREVMQVPELRQQFIDQGAMPAAGTPAQFQALIDNDRRRYAKIIQEKSIAVE
jgi:tripartite-type tricarboxylate transporter receptor subunit TctC